ncbi:polyketide synthase dehydratase domain-containing protein, partial [Streptomyces hygroscopicus]|uniref:polyketide synthase dehydratase domain-containing protein n=1 Tax=Streptomyces hygroscopicus TaxID=1912 RepID=UPI000A627AEB
CREAGERARLVEVDYASHSPQVDGIAGELAEVLGGVEPVGGPESGSGVVFYSTVTGGRVDPCALDTAYWVANLRERVRFADAVQALLADGHRVFIEASTHPVLTMGMRECFEDAESGAVAVPTLRRGHGGLAQLTKSVAQAFLAGAEVDWSAAFPADPPPRTVDLPTYAFQRERYWLDTPGGRGGDPAALGLAAADHPLLGAAVRLADGSGHVLTGRISPQTHGWLADHVVAGVALVPGAALMEWALRAADEADGGAVEELALRLPLVMPATGGRCVQVVVGPPADDGRRDIAVYSGPGDGPRTGGDADADWTCHAVGVLGPAVPEGRAEELTGTWPPPGARPADTEGFYPRAAASGYAYGPAFQGLRAVWRDGPDLLAEVHLPEAAGGPGGFGVHPALLDAVLHPAVLTEPAGAGPGPEPAEQRMWLPFTVNGLSLWASEATAVRVRLIPRPQAAEDERTLRVVVADAVGAPVLTIDALVLRPAEPGQLRSVDTGAATAGSGGGGTVRRRAAATAVGASSADWAARLARLSAVDQYRTLLGLVRDHAATVLGHTDAEAVHADVSFKELGFESLTAVELRDRLAAATGLRLPAALVFRYPTPEGVAHHLVRRLSSEATAAPTAIVAPDTQVPRQPTDEMSAAQRLESASADQVLEFIDNELGVS